MSILSFTVISAGCDRMLFPLLSVTSQQISLPDSAGEAVSVRSEAVCPFSVDHTDRFFRFRNHRYFSPSPDASAENDIVSPLLAATDWGCSVRSGVPAG